MTQVRHLGPAVEILWSHFRATIWILDSQQKYWFIIFLATYKGTFVGMFISIKCEWAMHRYFWLIFLLCIILNLAKHQEIRFINCHSNLLINQHFYNLNTKDMNTILLKQLVKLQDTVKNQYPFLLTK